MRMVNSICLAVVLLICLVYLGGCSTTKYSHQITPTFVSPANYANMQCAQLQAQLSTSRSHLSQVSDRQDSAKKSDRTKELLAWFLFWPAAFLIENEDHASEISRLKGEVSALEQLISQKCFGL